MLVIQPVVLLDAAWNYKNEALVKGDIFELPNVEIASIRTFQELQVSPVLESTLVPKTSYYDGITRTSLGTGSAPVYASSVVEDATPNLIEITFDINVFAPDDSGWTVEVNAGAVPVDKVSADAKVLTLVLDDAIVNGDVVTVAYADTGKTVDADAGNLMATLVAQTVTNSVT